MLYLAEARAEIKRVPPQSQRRENCSVSTLGARSLFALIISPVVVLAHGKVPSNIFRELLCQHDSVLASVERRVSSMFCVFHETVLRLVMFFASLQTHI